MAKKNNRHLFCSQICNLGKDSSFLLHMVSSRWLFWELEDLHSRELLHKLGKFVLAVGAHGEAAPADFPVGYWVFLTTW